ncbi:Zinc finger HIT domain-containing protein 2, partial [Linderina pennispora]
RHSECTESFYQAQVADELKTRQADDDVKKKMHELLQQYHQGTLEDADSDEQEEEDIAERMEGLNLDNASVDDIWKRMSEDERQEFLKLVNQGDLASVLPAWVPWWQQSDKPGVVEVGQDDYQAIATIPKISECAVPVQSLAKKVHPSVLYQIAQLALAYAYMMRHLNGDSRGKNITDAFQDLVTVSPLLSSKEADVYTNAHEALVVGLCNIDEGMPCSKKCAMLDDVLSMYLGPRYVASMVSDTHALLDTLLAMPSMSTETEPWEFMAAEVAMLQRRFRSEDEASKQSPNREGAAANVKVPSIGLV